MDDATLLLAQAQIQIQAWNDGKNTLRAFSLLSHRAPRGSRCESCSPRSSSSTSLELCVFREGDAHPAIRARRLRRQRAVAPPTRPARVGFADSAATRRPWEGSDARSVDDGRRS